MSLCIYFYLIQLHSWQQNGEGVNLDVGVEKNTKIVLHFKSKGISDFKMIFTGNFQATCTSMYFLGASSPCSYHVINGSWEEYICIPAFSQFEKVPY